MERFNNDAINLCLKCMDEKLDLIREELNKIRTECKNEEVLFSHDMIICQHCLNIIHMMGYFYFMASCELKREAGEN